MAKDELAAVSARGKVGTTRIKHAKFAVGMEKRMHV